MTGDGANNLPWESPHERGEEPDIPSHERGGNVDRVDEELEAVGYLPPDLGGGGLSEEDIERRVRAGADKALRDVTNRPTDAYIRRQLEETLRQPPVAEHKIPPQSEVFIVDFLRTMNVEGASKIAPADVTYLWEKLGKKAPYITDFALAVMALKANLSLSRYPLAISMDDLYDYAEDITDPRGLRAHSRAQAVQTLTDVGFDSKLITDNVYGEEVGRTAAAQVTRYIGWLISLPGMEGVPARTRIYVKEHGAERMSLEDLGLNAILHIYEAIDTLEAKRYRSGYPMENDARATHDSALRALHGMLNLSRRILLGSTGSGPKPETEP